MLEEAVAQQSAREAELNDARARLAEEDEPHLAHGVCRGHYGRRAEQVLHAEEAAELLHKPLHPLLPSFQVFEGAFHHLVVLDEFTHLFKGGTGTHGNPLHT